MKALVPIEVIEKKIILLRGQKVMLDKDLAELYGVLTRDLPPFYVPTGIIVNSLFRFNWLTWPERKASGAGDRYPKAL